MVKSTGDDVLGIEEKTSKDAKGAGSSDKKEDAKYSGFQNYLETLGVTKVLLGGLLIGLIIGGAFAYNFQPKSNEQQIPVALQASQKEVFSQDTDVPVQTISTEELKENTINSIIANNMVMPGTSVVINEVTEEKGLYKLDIILTFQGQSQNVESYATKDGKLFFPTALNISETTLEDPHPTTPAPTTMAPPMSPASASIVDDDPSKGPDNAPVTIVEFSDFQCPFCARAALVVRQIVDTYGDKVRIVYRDFPLSSIHPNAQKAAEAAECADDQEKFWEFHDTIFAHQDKMGVDDLKQFAKDLGLDSNNFDECLDSGKYEAEVKKDMQDGINAGVTSTPTFFINGEKVVGAQPFSALQVVIDSKLNPASDSGSILPAYALTNPLIERAYTISTEIPDVLEKIPCYCSCGTIGHKSLKECFISENGEFVDHASYCDICLREALDVDLWYKEGVSIVEIRSRIDEKYKGQGEPTETPL